MRYSDIYTESDWRKETEVALLYQHCPSMYGICRLKCPWCRLRGFYGPRKADGRHYRACKMCMLFQDVGGEIQQCRIAICVVCGTGANRLPSSPVGEHCGKPMTFNAKAASGDAVEEANAQWESACATYDSIRVAHGT